MYYPIFSSQLIPFISAFYSFDFIRSWNGCNRSLPSKFAHSLTSLIFCCLQTKIFVLILFAIPFFLLHEY